MAIKKRIKFVRSEEILSDPLVRPLFDDMVECEELLERSDSQFARRSYIRSAFAFIEADLYSLKGIARGLLLQKSRLDGRVDFAKLLLLSDQAYRVGENGKVKPSGPNKISFVSYCALIVRTIYESWGLDPSPSFANQGWHDMRTALKVRHRITHPNKPEDMEINEEELYLTSEGIRWMLNTISNAVRLRSEREGQSGGMTDPDDLEDLDG